MPQPTTAQKHKVNRDPISDAHVMLVEFQEDGQTLVHRAAVNNEDVTHNGNVYSRSSISVNLPTSSDRDTGATLKMSNIDRVIGRTIDAATKRINARLILIDTSIPDVAIVDTGNLLIVPNAQGDSTTITMELAPRASLLEPVPFQRTTQALFPGVWFA